ncbi:MAG: hypothetical protein HOP15_10165 [Planctomycetes bacterium]|nr:hypothetical protein [Planctomycetota bacterium]
MSLDQASLLHVGQGGGGGPGGGGDIRWPYCSGNANCTQCMGYYSCENFINFPWCRYVATEYSECNNNYPFSCGSTYWWTVLGCGGTAIAGDECFGNDC